MPENDHKINSNVIYPTPPSVAADEEFAAGVSTTASPSVKQVKNWLVTIDTVQNIYGQKTFVAGTKWQNAGGLNPQLFVLSDGFTLDGTKPAQFVNSSIYFRSNQSVEGVYDSNTLGCVEVFQTTDMTLPDLQFLIRNPSQSGWVSKFQVVSALPANPDERVFYFIPE